MDDETLMQHFESCHAGDLAMEFRPEPGRIERRLASSSAWNTYHDTLHRLWPEKYDHDHNEEATELPSTEQIYLVRDAGEAYMNRDHANRAHGGMDQVEEITLHRPDLRPIYGGPTLLEALWSEMDTLMERLMTGQTAEDGGDKFRAQELAWVLAIVTDPYEPSVDKIRAETMRRWEAAEAEADAQESALDPDEQQHQFDAAGVNGYEL